MWETLKKYDGTASQHIKRGALIDEKLTGISVFNAKCTNLKKIVSFIVHFSLGKHSFNLDTFLNTPFMFSHV